MQSAMEGLNTPQDAARLLKLLEYPEGEIVTALVAEYGIGEGEAIAIVSEQS